MNTTSGQYDLLARLMDASAVRQRVIGANIANVNTPGYQRQEVDFETQLAQLLEAGQSEKIVELQPVITTPLGGLAREDGNNVDIDKEMGALSKNSVLFETYAQILASKIGMMRSAISGRS
jgi:flagellar basal-body rod protein FlgB